MIDYEVWRWNGELEWHYFCSAHYEAHNTRLAGNEFIRVHHLRSSLYYGVATIEAYLNKLMRRHLEATGEKEDVIFQRLKRTPLGQKKEDWPSELFGSTFSFDEKFRSLFSKYLELRNEITHPKRRDHAIYVEMERSDPFEFIATIAEAMVLLFEAQNYPFPYWLLGWNFVGMNYDPAHPFMGNNMNGFVHSFSALGFNINSSDIHWDKKYMISVNDFRRLKEALDQCPVDIQQFNSQFPMMPRLTRRWWDRDFILSTIPNEFRSPHQAKTT